MTVRGKPSKSTSNKIPDCGKTFTIQPSPPNAPKNRGSRSKRSKPACWVADLTYRVVFARSARRELEDLPDQVAARLLQRIEALVENPRPRGAIKLRGSVDLWRIRSGDYRVVYRIDDAERLVDVIAARHRRDAYN
ncbi:MAG: type II toxin-antitoxin system RelE/ParE family toxin [Planctomycetota bacterium]